MTHGCATLSRWGRSAAMVERKGLGQYSSLSLSPTHLSHITNITLSKIKCDRLYFYIEVYSFVHWSSSLCLIKKLDGKYTRILRAILNKSWRQHPTRHQLHGHLPPIAKTIKVRRTKHAGHCWRSRHELISDVLLWTPTYGREKAGRPARTYTQDEALKTYQRRWTIGRSGERASGISVLAARHHNDDDTCSCIVVSIQHYLSINELGYICVENADNRQPLSLV